MATYAKRAAVMMTYDCPETGSEVTVSVDLAKMESDPGDGYYAPVLFSRVPCPSCGGTHRVEAN